MVLELLNIITFHIIIQCGEGTNRYTEFVPDDGDAHEMEKLNCTQSSNNDFNINVKLTENSAEFSAGNPFSNPKVYFKLIIFSLKSFLTKLYERQVK